MNTLDLVSFARSDPAIASCFVGVLALDQLGARVDSYPAAYIINTDKSTAPGEHWVALYFESEDVADYFDSYGLHPFGAIYDFAKANATDVYYNKKMIQSFTSKWCGAYCLYFLHFRVRGCAMSSIVSHFSATKRYDNDALVESVLLALTDV